jgi:excisionase family DNA binding protein
MPEKTRHPSLAIFVAVWPPPDVTRAFLWKQEAEIWQATIMDTTPLIFKIAYTVATAQEATGLGRGAIYDAVSSGKLPAKKRGTSTLILADDLKAWIAGLPAWTPSLGRVEAAAIARDAKAAARRAQAEAHQAVTVTPRREAAAARKRAVAERRALAAAE